MPLVELCAVSYQGYAVYQRSIIGNLAEVMPPLLADFGIALTPGEY